jgi:uncharacterized protein (DUF2249 family)/hemerythrin-like domain-containing protein
MTQVMQGIDLRRLAAGEQIPEALAAFDALQGGERLVLVGDEIPRGFLAHLQQERPGAFDWNLLEGGPDRYRVEVVRRARARPRDVEECLGEDHRRLGRIFVEVERLIASGAFAEAGRRIPEFACGMFRHIEIEERILFPEFEDVTGGEYGPTNALRADHLRIRRLLAHLEWEAHAADHAACAHTLEKLRRILIEHHVKEEETLYPMVDGGAGTEELRDQLVRRIQAF